MKQFLEVGKIINTRGFKGEVKLESYCDTPKCLTGVPALFLDEDGKNGIRVLSVKIYKDFVYIFFDGVTTEEAALSLRGKTVYADRAYLPKDKNAHFIADLLNLPVYDADDGNIYGTIIDVTTGKANDIYHVQTQNGVRLLPAVKAFIKSIDTEKGVAVTPIPGLFDEAEEIHE